MEDTKYVINLTGSGTREQIVQALRNFAEELDVVAEEDICDEYEIHPVFATVDINVRGERMNWNMED